MRERIRQFLRRPVVLSVLGGLLLSLPWAYGLGPVVLIAWIPWLVLLHDFTARRTRYVRSFLLLFLGAVVWNLHSVWWITGATLGGMVGAVLAMAFLMALVLTVVVWAWRVKGQGLGLALLTTFWLAFEYFFHNSEIAWPWLTLGNGLARQYYLVQWYEFTGVLGGSLWALGVNLLAFGTACAWRKGRLRKWLLAGLAVLTLGPVVGSLIILRGENARIGHESQRPVEVAIIQPNIDPWREKFQGLSPLEQVDLMVDLAQGAVTPSTSLILSPETSIAQSLWEEERAKNIYVSRLRGLVEKHPQTCWVTGATTLRLYPGGLGRTFTARRLRQMPGSYYDAYNSALRIDTSLRVPIYHKSKLVVGVEMLPYPKYLNQLHWLNIDLGGMVGCLGTQAHRVNFETPTGVDFAPIICYESVFGEFCTEYVRSGAKFLTVITNDGWWGDTPGYRQHFSYSQLRCIETRRYMARSANTGISAIITPTGRVEKELDWWTRGTLVGRIYPRGQTTFYVQHGDFIGRIASWTTLLLVLYLVAQTVTRRREKSRSHHPCEKKGK